MVARRDLPPRASAHLPDTLIGVLPTCFPGVSNLDQKVACDLVELAVAPRFIVGVTVDVELALIPGAVADAHGSAGTPSSQVAERALTKVMLATYSEHDL